MFEARPPVAPSAAPVREQRGRKLAAAATAALLVTGTWFGWSSYAAQTAPLPGVTGRGGACEIWFVGSSTFGRWTSLPVDMRPWAAVNRGVNGARIDQLLRRFRHEPAGPGPAAIVFYGGENDIAFGRNAGEVFGTLERLVDEKRARFGATPMILLSLKLAPKRVMDRIEHDRFDAAMRIMVAQSPDLRWLNVGPLTLVNGRPGPFFAADGIHLDAAGYALWRRAMRPGIAQALPPALVAKCGAHRP